MISIVIPVYNTEKYLRECLDSLLRQTFQDFEIICVNDGSTDGSLEILEEYAGKDSRIRLLNQKHEGAGSARNAGIEAARGKYIQFLDSDDFFQPDMLEEFYNTAEKYGADVVVCSGRTADLEGNIIENENPNFMINFNTCPINRPFSKYDFPKNIFSLFSSAAWNKFYLRKLITDNNLRFQNLSSCNDLGFVRIADASAERIVVINRELINYRAHRVGGISYSRASKTINLIKAGKYVKDFLIKNNMYKFLEDAHIYAMKRSVSWEISLCNEEQYKKFFQELKQLMPQEWKIYCPVLRKEYITPEYIKTFIGNKKVLLWGASIFLGNVLKNEKVKNPNILGIIDKNPDKQGKFLGGYEIFPPESLSKLKPDGVLFTIQNNYEKIYPELKKELEAKYPEIELLPNIFEAEDYE